MSDTTKCVSLANGALSPDLRVNYEFGLVLGVDEFRQEQLYLLEKEHLLNRALHGYGTVYGLQVTTTRPLDNDDEVLITVQPGMALDQWGRPVVVRAAQCARLGAWLAKQEPATVAQYAGASGDLHVFVVLRYEECFDSLVPIPGQPCSSSASSQVPSRIRDAYHIELRWEPPQMQAWEVVQRFARLLGEVQLVPDLPPQQSDEQAIVALVRDLDNPQWEAGQVVGSPPGTALYRLPTETAREALDRIFTVWVTEVRPRLQPDLTQPADGSEAAILLARLDFLPDDSFDRDNPAIPSFNAPDDAGRPFLLHTQLIQEGLLLGSEAGAGGKAQRQFATLGVAGPSRLVLWCHHPDPLDNLASAMTLTSDGAPQGIGAVNVLPELPNLYEILLAEGSAILPGSRVTLQLQLDFLESNGVTLADALEALGHDYVDRDYNILSLYALAEPLPTIREFVTVDTVPGEQPRLNLWFHTSEPIQLPETLDVARGLDGEVVSFTSLPLSMNPTAHAWQLIPPSGVTLLDNEAITLTFNTDEIGWDGRSMSQVIQETHLAFLGYDGATQIRAFYQVELPPATAPGPDGGPSIETILEEMALRLPTLPFVTATASRTIEPFNGYTIELWFHLDRVPTRDSYAVQPEMALQIFAEVEPQEAPLPIRFDELDNPRHNVHLIGIRLDELEEARNSPYLRLVFDTTEMKLLRDRDALSVRELIKSEHIKFEGHNGAGEGGINDTIVAYLRLPTDSQLRAAAPKE